VGARLWYAPIPRERVRPSRSAAARGAEKSAAGAVSVWPEQKIQVGIGHAGQTVAVEEADTTFRVYRGDQLIALVLRTSTKQVARFKARKPEPSRRSSSPCSDPSSKD
jgi:hypothetical protein